MYMYYTNNGMLNFNDKTFETSIHCKVKNSEVNSQKFTQMWNEKLTKYYNHNDSAHYNYTRINWVLRTQEAFKKTLGVFTWTRITFRKTFQNVIRPLMPDVESLILAHVNNIQPGIKSGFWNAFMKRRKSRAFWIVIRLVYQPDSSPCERKAVSERDSVRVHFKHMPVWSHA